MYQEAALALALAAEDHEGWPQVARDRLRALATAAIRYAAACARRNGALDDYYPYEQAVGATAFALRACVEAASLLRLRDPACFAWFKKAAGWLARHRESGRLANHLALVALCLHRVGRLLDDASLLAASRERLHELLQWQSHEGWFAEYEGCDPGYHTVTIAFLADLWHATRDPVLFEALRRAVRFALAVQHPDGTVGGSYGSRNSSHAYTHGFERLAHHLVDARLFLAQLHRALRHELQVPMDDDRLCAHYAVDYALAYRDAAAFVESASSAMSNHWFPEAGIVTRTVGNHWLISRLTKAGAFRLYRDGTLHTSDAGLVVELDDGTVLASAAGTVDRAELRDEHAELEGWLGQARHPLLSPLKQIAFRAVTLTVARRWPNAIRRLLQKVAITTTRPSRLRYRRYFEWGPPLKVVDELTWHGPRRVRRVFHATDATFIYVAASNTYDPAALLAWHALPEVARQLNESGRARIVRIYG